ncbi:hypothetical protein ES706_01671 [subsurface metagenome]
MEEKTKNPLIVGLIALLVVGITLVTLGILQPWQNTLQNTPPDTPRYTEQAVIDMAMNHVRNINICGGRYNPTDGYATYLGVGLWRVEVHTSRRGIVTVHVDEKTGTVH